VLGAVPSKQAKQSSKGLVFGAVVVRCYAKVRCCAVVGAVRVQGCGFISKQGLGAGFCAVR
jgi:hypothetical protein